MDARLPTTVSLGELVAMTFDAARRFETDPRETSRLAVSALANMLQSARPVILLVAPPGLRLRRVGGVASRRNDRDRA